MINKFENFILKSFAIYILRIIIVLTLAFIYSCGNSEQNENLPDISQANKIKLFYKMDFD